MNEEEDKESDKDMDEHPEKSNTSAFVCVTCRRGPPFAKKYARNQCQTCYKRVKLMQDFDHQNGAFKYLQQEAQFFLS